jgi:apolipoprotein N-acyltransferase
MLESRERSLGNPTASAALLQPNIAQEMRWDARQLLDIFERMAQMTDAATEKKVDAIIWPESTVPLTYVRTDFFRDYVESTSRKANVDIILGSVAEDEADPSRIWNAAYLVSNGETKGRYDKIRLVPFGEYVPLRKFLFFAEKLVHQVGEFQFGANDHPLSGRFHYGPAICYEVVFPRITARQIENGADVLVTVTNDAWFGRSAAPEQHLAQARMRAIEGDRYLLRAATTGISAVVDPTGRVVQSQPLGTQGTIVARFSPRHSKTAYVRFGDWFAAAAVLGSVVVLFVRRRR